MKDYYAILGCTPMSTPEEIKRHYRQLAMKYHPDKNGGDQYAAAYFNDIKTAYETLTQPQKKAKWLEERWLNQVMNNTYTEKSPMTPQLILLKVLQMEKYIALHDAYRMDHWTLSNQLESILSSENIDCLNQFHQAEINRTIIHYILETVQKLRLTYTLPIFEKLKQLAGSDDIIQQAIDTTLQKIIRKEKWAGLTLPIIVGITVLLCFMLFFLGRMHKE